MVTVVVVEFGVMRCQPLRRALCRCNHHIENLV
ncbi:acetyltransferase [Vibrio cholerae]|nr:acetyltransferase [Vibrio cholerae]